jgi:hypothetical protein
LKHHFNTQAPYPWAWSNCPQSFSLQTSTIKPTLCWVICHY